MGKKEPDLPIEEAIEKYREAGKIARKVREGVQELVKPGVKYQTIVETIENEILDRGAKWSFPCNISVNEIAAHYTSPYNDENVIQENDIVKIDFGAHVDGYISDNAFTVSLDPQYERLVEASKASTNAAINALRAGVKTNITGAIVEQTISEFGYKAVRNLSGHLLERYELHAGKSLPSAVTGRGDPVKENEVYAVETFASTGTGMVHDRTDQCYIFMLTPKRVPIRSKIARQCLSIINREFKTLPFASRWLTQHMKPTAVNIGLRELSRAGLIHKYHPLADIKGSVISQHEHTVLIMKSGTEILT